MEFLRDVISRRERDNDDRRHSSRDPWDNDDHDSDCECDNCYDSEHTDDCDCEDCLLCVCCEYPFNNCDCSHNSGDYCLEEGDE